VPSSDPDRPPGDEARPLRPRELARLAAALGLVSVGAAAFAMGFRLAAQLVYGALLGGHDVLDAFERLPLRARALLPIAGGVLAGAASRLASKEAGHGVGDVMEAVALGEGRLSVRATLAKALGSWFAIVSGNSVGREGPLILFGGSLGARVASVLRVREQPARGLIAAGTAAGFAAAYNTPLAAALFVVEIVTGVVTIDLLAMVLVGTAISTALLRATVGGGPIYGQRGFAFTSPRELVAHAALGLVAALVAQAFMRMLAAGERVFGMTSLGQPWRAGLGGALVGLLAVVLPEVTGNGYEPLNRLLDGQYAVGLVAILIAAKALATTASVSSGSPGGVFTPSLFIGGGIGLLWGHAFHAILGGPASQGGYALVGMAAMIAATTHAPLMASVLVFELSGDYALVLPLVLATALATITSRWMRRDSIYAAELHRRGVAWEMTLAGRKVERRGSEAPSDEDGPASS
jgi:CIC family chloride channel protein